MELYKQKFWLEQKYLVEKLSAPEIGELCGCSGRTILNWLITFDIPRRTPADSIRGKFTGEKAFAWGLKRSEETRQKISAYHADVSGQNNSMFGRRGEAAPAYGKIRTIEHRAKLSQALKGKRRPDIAGEKNHNWKGGKTPLLVNIRNSPKGVEWRNAVFAKDDFTCQKCGDGQGGNLNAHHHDRLSDMVARYGITNLEEAYACEPLWNLDNGITLCETCHDEHHRSKKPTRLKTQKP
jgi:hypothetical protein